MKAKALYDNCSDDLEELTFLKNDVMEVIEQDYDGMEGWWLCKLNGKTGIAPGNRLMIITVVDDSKDYDTPKALLNDRKSRNDDYDTPASKSALNTPSSESSSSDKRSSSNSNKSTESVRSHSNLLNESSFSKLFVSFKKAHKNTKVPGEQIMQMVDKWSSCPNSSKLQLVIKTMCVNMWKQLQEYLSESSKLFASLKPLASPEAVVSIKKTKELSRDMEDVLQSLSRPNLDQGNFQKSLKQLKEILKPLLESMSLIEKFYDNVDSEKLWLKVVDEEAGSRKKHQSTLSFSSVDYDLPRNSKVNDLTDVSKDSAERGRKSDLQSQMKKLRIEQLNKSSNFTDYDRPKSIDNLDQATTAAPSTTDYDMPRNSVDEVSVKKDFPHRPQSLDALDYDSPASSRQVPSIKNTKAPSEQTRAASDYIANPDYDVPASENTRKSMEQLLGRPNKQAFEDKFNLPQKTFNKESRAASTLDPSDYDYPSASQLDITDINNNIKPSQYSNNISINDLNSQYQTTYDIPPKKASDFQETKTKRQLPNFDKAETNLLQFYTPHLNSQLKIVSRHLDLMLEQVEDSRLEVKELAQQVRYLAISSHKFVFVVDFLTRQLAGHKLFCREITLICNKIVDHLKTIASSTKQGDESNVRMSQVGKIKQSLGDLKGSVESAEEILQSWQF